MSEPKTPRYRYVVASFGETEHAVMVVHEDSPDWYRRVASFVNKRRAEDYADMENDFRPGGSAGLVELTEKPLDGREGDERPASQRLRAEPPSALIPGELVRRSTVVEHIRLEHEEVFDREAAAIRPLAQQPPAMITDDHQCTPVYTPAVSDEKPPKSDKTRSDSVETSQNTPESAEDRHVPPAPDSRQAASTLDPVTEGQLAVFNLVASLKGQYLSITDMAGRVNVAEGSIGSHLIALCKKGYLERLAVDGWRKAYAVIVRGTPVNMDEDATATMSKVRAAAKPLIDAATLPALTGTQASLFRALQTLLPKEPMPTGTVIAKAAGINHGQVQSAMDALRRKGYVENIGRMGMPTWHLLAVGEPKVSEKGEGVDPWLPAHDDLLKAAGRTGEMSIPELALALKRIEGAVTARLTKHGLFHTHQAARAAKDLPKPAQAAARPVETAQAPRPKLIRAGGTEARLQRR